jgi:alkylation response protein AidB-like acyl-CoA dehydrogenase
MFAFSGSPEKEALRATVREFAACQVEPVALEHDGAGTAPLDLLWKFADLGLISRWLGPAGDDSDSYFTETCIATEELGYACAATASLIMLPILFNRIVLRGLSEPARSAFRERVVSEPVVTSFAATERTAGSDLLSVETRARRVDGGYVMDGRKEYSSNVRHAAYVIVVAGTGDDGKRDAGGLTWFLVPTDAPGVEIGERWQTLGLRAMDVSPVNLAGVRVPAEHRIGEEGRGFAMMGSSLAHSRTGIAAVGVGIARRARDEVIAFGSRRVLYGGKLHKQQDFRFRIAEMEKEIAAARALVSLSALKQDQGLDATKEASIAKAFAGQMVMRVTDLASQMLGSIGYTGQSIVDKLYRDARHVAIVEGSEATHKEIIFASVLRRGGY